MDEDQLPEAYKTPRFNTPKAQIITIAQACLVLGTGGLAYWPVRFIHWELLQGAVFIALWSIMLWAVGPRIQWLESKRSTAPNSPAVPSGNPAED